MAVHALGLLGIELPLMLGIGVRIAGYIGIAMYALITPENNPFLDDHIIGMIIMAGLIVAAAGSPIGLGKLWVRIPLVKKYPLLK
jgi:thiosulfate dehydrogenase [quinone] large subunit